MTIHGAGMKGAGAVEPERESPRPLPVLSRKSFISRTLVITEAERKLISKASTTKRGQNPQSPSIPKSESHPSLPSLGSDSDAESCRSSTSGSVRSTPSQSPLSPYALGWKDSLRGVTPGSGPQPNITSKSPRFASMTPVKPPSPRVRKAGPQSPSGGAIVTSGSAKRYYESPKSVSVTLNSPGKGSRTPRGRQTPPRKERSAPQLQGSPRRKKGSQPASPGSGNPGLPSTEISFTDLRSDNEEAGGPAIEGEGSFSSADGEPMTHVRGLWSAMASSGEFGGGVLGYGLRTKSGASALGESKQGNPKHGAKSGTTVRGRRTEQEDPTSSNSSLNLRPAFRQGQEAVLRNHPPADITFGVGGSPSSRLRLLQVTGDDVTVVDQDSGQLSPDKVQRTAKDLVGASFGRGGLGPGFKGWSGPPRSEGDAPVGSIAPGNHTPQKETLRKTKSAPRFDPLRQAQSSSADYRPDVSLDAADVCAASVGGPVDSDDSGVMYERRPRKAWGAFHSSLSPRRFGQLMGSVPAHRTPRNGESENEASENGTEAQVNRTTGAEAFPHGRLEVNQDVSISSADDNLAAVLERIRDVHTAQSSDSERDSLGRVYPGQDVEAGRGAETGANGRGAERDVGRWEGKVGIDKKQQDAWEGACKREELQGLRLKEILDYKAQMKEKFVRLLLGDDLSGGSRGASPALAISHAVTNLAGAVFGDVYTLEPLDIDKKLRWTREIDWLISPAYQIVEMRPGWVVTPAGTKTEIMQRQPRGDLQASLPVLKKLDALLMDTMDTLINQEFSYKSAPRTVTSSDVLDAYWRPKAVVPAGGLSPEALRKLRGQKEVVTNIYAVAMAINAQTLAEMAIPDEYWESLPRSSKAALGEELYRALTEDGFENGGILSALGVADETSAARVASALEAAIHLWQRKIVKRGQEDHVNEPVQSWRQRVETMTGHGAEARERWVARASELLHTLFATFPGLPHTRLAQSKIHHNKDVGQAILESYSRVLETVASNLLAGISHVLDSHEEAYSLGKALRASADYSLNQNSPTSLLTNPAPTPPKTPGDSDRSSGLAANELEGEDTPGGQNVPAGNPLQKWVVLEGRSAQSAQNPGKGLDVLRTAVGRFA